MEWNLAAGRLGVHLASERLCVALDDGIYDPPKRAIFLKSMGNLCRMRLSVPLTESVQPPVDPSAPICWTLPPLTEEIRLQLTRVLRVLALLVEHGADPFAALGQAEQFDLRWRQLQLLLAAVRPAPRPYPAQDGHLWLLGELTPGSSSGAPGLRLLLDPAGNMGHGRERLLLHGVAGAVDRTPSELAQRLSQVLPGSVSLRRRPTDPLPSEGCYDLELFVNAGESSESWSQLVAQLMEQLRVEAVPGTPAGTAPPPSEGPLGAPKPMVAGPDLATVRAAPTDAAVESLPVITASQLAAPSVLSPGHSANGRGAELRRAAELGLSPPPEWPAHLASPETARVLPEVDPPSVLEDLRHGVTGAAPADPSTAVRGLGGPADEEEEASFPEQVPVNLVLTSAGPFPDKLRRVLSILITVDYPRSGDLIRNLPTILLRGAPPSLARRYAQVLRQAGGRCRIVRTP